LAEKYGVSIKVIERKSAKEKWVEQKKCYINKVFNKTIDKISEKEVDKLVKLQKAADSMSNVIANVFDDLDQFNRHLVQTKEISQDSQTCGVEEKIYKKVDTKAIKDMTAAMKNLTTTVRNLYDIPTAYEQSARDMAANKLKMEQEKMQREAEKGNVEDVVIKLEGPINGYSG